MPFLVAFDPERSSRSASKQPSLSDGESDTTAKTSDGGRSVSSSDSSSGEKSAELTVPSATVELPQRECLDYIHGKCVNGANCPLKHYWCDEDGNKKEFCKGFLKGRCTYGLKCKFHHPSSELMVVSPGCRNSRPLDRVAAPQESAESRPEVRLMSLGDAVGMDGTLGEVLWCGLDPQMYDTVCPPATADGVARQIAPEYAVRFIEECSGLRMPTFAHPPAGRSLAAVLRGLADRLPPNHHQPHVLLVRDRRHEFVHLILLERLQMPQQGSISTSASAEHGEAISERRLTDFLNRPRVDAQDGSLKNSDGSIRRAVCRNRGRSGRQ